jgi:hypothetical protein
MEIADYLTTQDTAGRNGGCGFYPSCLVQRNPDGSLVQDFDNVGPCS